MKTNRAFALTVVLLLVVCAGLAACLDRWFMGWQGNRASDFNPLKTAIGEGQKIFAGHFYRKADVYFHSGMYPSIFDNNESFKTAHIGEDAGATGSKNTGDEATYLGRSRDIIDQFSRHFFPVQHTHLDEGGATGRTHSHGENEPHQGGQVAELGDGASGEVREILPWLKIAQELDPEDPLTYTVTAYWLRRRMNKPHEAELLLRAGLRELPDHPALLFELGRIYSENEKDSSRARNVWRHAAQEWKKQAASKTESDTFIVEQILTHLAKLEEAAGNLPLAISYWEQAKAIAPEREVIPERIKQLQQELESPNVLP